MLIARCHLHSIAYFAAVELFAPLSVPFIPPLKEVGFQSRDSVKSAQPKLVYPR